MADLEKTILGLRYCSANVCSIDDDKCPYYDDDDPMYCIQELSRDALELLQKQKAQIMTPEEVEAVRQQDLVWIEIRRTDALYPAIRDGNDFVGNGDYFILGEITDCDDYLRWYRFWSARPSEERRHATPWEDTDG